MAVPGPAPIKNDGPLTMFYNSPLFSDVEIKFSGNTFPGHRTILSSQSVYFHKAFSGDFMEAHSKVIDLGDNDDPECIHTMLKFIYGCPIHDPLNASGHTTELLHMANLFTTADKYDVVSLRRYITRHITDFGFLIARHDEADFIKSLEVVFDHVGDQGLQNLMLQHLARDVSNLMEVDAFVQMLEERSSLSVRFLKSITDVVNRGVKIWICEKCSLVSHREGVCMNGCEMDGWELEERILWDGMQRSDQRSDTEPSTEE